MTTPMSSTDLRSVVGRFIKLAIVWGPIVVGVVHQLLMYFFCIDRIYVFLEPPGFIAPFVTVEIQWWIVLLLVSSTLCILASMDRIQPHRLVYPFYFYILFLLIFVKPIEPLGLFCS